MDIVGDRRFVEIPGDKTHELPPLLVRATPEVRRLDRVVNMANQLIESEQILPALPGEDLLQDPEVDAVLSRRRMDLAINMVDQYLAFLTHWRWGDSVVEWIRQCEITFENSTALRPLLRPDVWPHAGRSSFVTLLADKSAVESGVDLESAVGMRLTFRQPPPISCFSDQFLLYLNGELSHSAYRVWSGMNPSPVSSLPPERFHFDVFNMQM
jgi:hypothetical protein